MMMTAMVRNTSYSQINHNNSSPKCMRVAVVPVEDSAIERKSRIGGRMMMMLKMLMMMQVVVTRCSGMSYHYYDHSWFPLCYRRRFFLTSKTGLSLLPTPNCVMVLVDHICTVYLYYTVLDTSSNSKMNRRFRARDDIYPESDIYVRHTPRNIFVDQYFPNLDQLEMLQFFTVAVHDIQNGCTCNRYSRVPAM